jgi:hypothetical protein
MSTHNHIFTPFSILDPALMRKQIETALDEHSLFTPVMALSDTLMQTAIQTATGRDTIFAIRGLTDPQWTPDALAAAMGLDTSP